jgi:hypothetical protein
MRRVYTTTEVDALSDSEKRSFIECHVPYRLRFLHLGLGVYPPNCSMERAAFETALVHGRQLIEFLGLGTDFDRDPPNLFPKESYHRYKRNGVTYTDEVKITDIGGKFLKPSDLTPVEESILAQFSFGASKATAHLTEGSDHKLHEKAAPSFVRDAN